MPDYKRLVSYIYNYEEGIKRNNVGYARVEARNGQCKYTIHITAPSLNDKHLKAYLFKRRKDGLEGILLGTTQIKNGIGDFKTQTNSARIMNSPYSLDDMGGIILFLSESKFFATEWDDIPITRQVISSLEENREEIEKRLELEQKAKKEELNRVEALKAIIVDDQSNILKAADILVSNAELEQEFNSNSLVERKEASGKLVEIEDLGEGKDIAEREDLVEKEEIDEREDLDEREEIDEREDIVEKEEIVEREDLVESEETVEREDLVKKENIDEREYLDEREDTGITEDGNNGYYINGKENLSDKVELGDEENQIDAKNLKDIDFQEDTDYQDDCECDTNHDDRENLYGSENSYNKEHLYDKVEKDNSYNTLYKDGNDCTVNYDNTKEHESHKNIVKPIFEEHPLAKRIYRSFPRMYPFEDNEIAWCVRMEPQNIGLFPMEAWVLGNNSFLLHGYYSYRHLIFARINNKNGFNYILGVPGIYHNREKFMANMFGFENFKAVKRIELKTGEFGYWYIPIVLD